MTGKRLDQLGTLQQAVMGVLWAGGEATVEQVRAALRGRKRPAYTTVLSVLQKLEKRGWVRHRPEGRAYVYSPARSREQAGSSALWKFVDGVFRGDPLVLFEHLIKGDRLGNEDLATLRKMIDVKRKGRAGGSKRDSD